MTTSTVSPAETSYRTDIDVLRAFAVLSVVLYHIDTSLLPGGFVGVDVFFVISGYLITGQLTHRMQRAREFSFTDFYVRRFKRLYPALTLVLAVSVLLSAWIMIPSVQNQLGREVRAVATLSINYYFLGQKSDYFGITADNKPLLHLWTLSVEEQFYLLWPVLLWLLYRLAEKQKKAFVPLVRLMLILVLSVSCLWCIFISFHNNPQAFYGLPSRAWEFAAGGLLTLWPLPTHSQRSRGSLLQLMGCGILLYSIFCIDSHAVFPGFVVLWPVIGAMLYIAGGRLGLLPLWQRLLCRPALLHTGKISYGFYLWHWVLLAFCRYWYLGRDLQRDLLMGGLVAYVFAHLSYRYVELPLRHGTTFWPVLNQLQFRHGMYTLFLMYLIGNIQIFYPVMLTSTQASIARLENDPVHLPPGCTMPPAGIPLDPIGTCSLGNPERPLRLVVWGDSHAGRLLPLLQRYTAEHPVRILTRIYNGCPPLMQVVPSGQQQYRTYCQNFATAVAAQMGALKSLGVTGIILQARWLWYLSDTEPEALDLLTTEEYQQSLKSGQLIVSTAHSTELLHRVLDKELKLFQAEGMKVALVLPEPELDTPAPECLIRFNTMRCNRPLHDVLQQRQALVAWLNEEATHYKNLQLIDTTPFFCDLRWCFAEQNGIVNFMDSHHITSARALSMYPFFTSVLNWLAQPRGEPDRPGTLAVSPTADRGISH